MAFQVKTSSVVDSSPFLNNDLWTYFHDRKEKVDFVRRRPYKKNDNTHVEQKNWTHVRQFLGYDRLDQQWDVDYINDMYTNYWLPLWNYFTPVMKLKSKTRVGGKIIKVHDEPKTPYHRLLDYPKLSQEEKLALMARAQDLNPFRLKDELEKKNVGLALSLSFSRPIIPLSARKAQRSSHVSVRYA